MALPTLAIAVENHHARDCRAFLQRIRSQGYRATVFTDDTDHYLRRTHSRWEGNFTNYLRLLTESARDHADADWLVALQDDVSLPTGVFDKMRWVLQFTAGPIVAFYVPQNGEFNKAVAGGYHVVETPGGAWIQALAFAMPVVPTLVAWAHAHCVPVWEETGDGPSDDDFISLYCSHERVPQRVIIPSFVQHEGYDQSLMKTSWQVGQFPRISACYDPDFDPSTVDWVRAFAQPYRARFRYSRSDPRYQRSAGLL